MDSSQNSSQVLERGAGEEMIRSVGPMVWAWKKCYKKSRRVEYHTYNIKNEG